MNAAFNKSTFFPTAYPGVTINSRREVRAVAEGLSVSCIRKGQHAAREEVLVTLPNGMIQTLNVLWLYASAFFEMDAAAGVELDVTQLGEWNEGHSLGTPALAWLAPTQGGLPLQRKDGVPAAGSPELVVLQARARPRKAGARPRKAAARRPVAPSQTEEVRATAQFRGAASFAAPVRRGLAGLAEEYGGRVPDLDAVIDAASELEEYDEGHLVGLPAITRGRYVRAGLAE